MKKLLISAAFVAMLATPALAQSYNPDYGTGNINTPYASIYGGDEFHNDDAYAYAPATRRAWAAEHPRQAGSVDAWVNRYRQERR